MIEPRGICVASVCHRQVQLHSTLYQIWLFDVLHNQPVGPSLGLIAATVNNCYSPGGTKARNIR